MAEVIRRALVSGRVQGVGYRMACAREAGRLDLAGYARNLADGRVEVVVRGGPEEVAALLAWCRLGPPGARVTEVAEAAFVAPPGQDEAVATRPFGVR